MTRDALTPGEHGTVGYTLTKAGTWEARTLYCDPRGNKRIVTATAPTKSAAQRKLSSRITGTPSKPAYVVATEQARPLNLPPTMSQPASASAVLPLGATIKPSTSVGSLARFFLADKGRYGTGAEGEQIAPQTLAGYEGAVRRQIEPLLGPLRLEHVNIRLLEEVFAEEFDRGRSVDLMHSVLKQAFDLAVRDQALPANPMTLVRYKKRSPGEKGTLTSAQSARLVLMLDPQALRKPGAHRGPNGDLRDVVLLGLATGCRIGELLGLHWSDVDLDDPLPRLRVVATVVEPRGEYVEKLHRQPRPKTRESRRTLILPDVAVDMLRRRRDVSDPECPLVFASSKNTLLWPNNIRTRLRAAVGEFPDLRGTTPHTLRRTVATHIFDRVGLEASAVQLGHRLPGITAANYIQRRERDLRKVLSELLPPHL